MEGANLIATRAYYTGAKTGDRDLETWDDIKSPKVSFLMTDVQALQPMV